MPPAPSRVRAASGPPCPTVPAEGLAGRSSPNASRLPRKSRGDCRALGLPAAGSAAGGLPPSGSATSQPGAAFSRRGWHCALQKKFSISTAVARCLQFRWPFPSLPCHVFPRHSPWCKKPFTGRWRSSSPKLWFKEMPQTAMFDRFFGAWPCPPLKAGVLCRAVPPAVGKSPVPPWLRAQLGQPLSFLRADGSSPGI